MDPPLLQQLQLSSEYQISPDHECVDPTSHVHHSPFVNGRDTLGTPSILTLSHGGSSKCLTSRQTTESSYSGTSPSLPDTGSSTGSTPSGNSIAFTFPPSTSLSSQTGSSSSLQGSFLANSPIFEAPFGFPQSSFSQLGSMPNTRPQLSAMYVREADGRLRLQCVAGTPVSSNNHFDMLTSPRSGDTPNSAILHSIRTPNIATASHDAGPSVRERYTTSPLGIHRHLSSQTQMDLNRSFPDPRQILSQPTGMSFPSPSSFGVSTAYQTPRPQADSPPFDPQETLVNLKQEDGSSISVAIDCRIEKGFFLSGDGCWTCYRRNYFSVCCSYSLQPLPGARNVFLERHGKPSKFEQIQAMAVCLSAVVDGTTGKTVDLVQHTPKRDRGPQTSVQKTKILPKPPVNEKLPSQGQDLSSYNYHFPLANHPQITTPNFPLQQTPDLITDISDDGSGPSGFAACNTSPNAYQHTFERIQFKSATANNGKRRAQQQYYHLIVELWADIRPSGSSRPEWVKVAHRLSSQVVVRGRSPSHYSNEGPNSMSRGGPSGTFGGSGSLTPTSNSWSASLNPGGASSSTYQNPLPRYSGSSSGSLPYSLSAHSHAHHHSHQNDQTSAGSLMPMADPSHLPSNGSTAGYHYYPGPLYNAGLASPSAKAMVKQESKTGDDQHGAGSAPFQMSPSNCRIIGVDSSRGIYQFGNAGHDGY